MSVLFSGKQDVYLEIAEKYKDYMNRGVFRKGDRLPSVRTAAEELGVNPNTVARAYAALEAEGYIVTLPKKGVYVAETTPCEAVVPEEWILVRKLRELGVGKEKLYEIIEEVYS